MDYRLFFDKAKENLKAAELCFDHGLFNACVNRAYYAMFHAAIAALANEGITPVQEVIGHDWVQARFAGDLIRKKRLYPGLADYPPETQRRRDEADYKLIFFNRKKVKRVFDRAKNFVQRVGKELGK